MPSFRVVEFSEVAEAGIKRISEDESKQVTLKESLKWYLRRDAEYRAVPCPAFEDKQLFLYPFSQWRVLFEVSDMVIIWSVRPAKLD